MWIILVALALAAILALFYKAAARTRAAAAEAEQQVPPVGRMVSVPHAQLHVVDKGRVPPGGRAILMVHGLAGQLHHFTYGLLDDLARDTRVVVFDRPGSGYSTRDPGHLVALQDQADAVAALIDALGLGAPLVVGHSLGGALALTLALRHPDKVSALALLAPATREPDSVPAAFRGLNIPMGWLQRLVAHTVAVPIATAQRDRILGIVFGPEAVPADYDRRAGGLLSLRPSHIVATAEDLRGIPKRLHEIETLYSQLAQREPRLPIHILYGRGDRILDPQFQGQGFVQMVPHARLELIEGGHMLPVTQPERCAAFIRQVMAL